MSSILQLASVDSNFMGTEDYFLNDVWTQQKTN